MPDRPSIAIISASSVITVGLAMMCHESAHVLAGWLAGGSPTMITSTETLGDFRSLSPAGLVALGISGSVINLLFSLLGWWILRRASGTPELRLTAWFFFAVNGMLVVSKMLGEPLAGFGDWMTVLRPLPGTNWLRILVVLLGGMGMVIMVRRSGTALGELLPSGEPSRRMADARRIVAIGAAASAVLVLGGAAANPVGTTRGMLLALGAGLGPFVPMTFAIRHIRRATSKYGVSGSAARWPWLLAAAATTLVTWFVVGPGLSVTGIPSRAP
ncbi:MAG: hypothetical protein AB7Q69_09195 [Gemmatimonadales bacterium]